jgi:thioredoxin 1
MRQTVMWVLVVVLLGAAGTIFAVKRGYIRNPLGSATGTDASHDLPPVFAQESYDQALATPGDKPVVVVMSASWCAPCQQMKQNVWTDPAVADWFGANAKAVYVDVEKDEAASARAKVEFLPTLILYRNGRELKRATGAMGVTDLLAWAGSDK